MKPSLTFVGKTPHGHFRLTAESKTLPGLFHDVLVSKDGRRVSCDCAACAFHGMSGADGRLAVPRSDVLGGKVKGCCWHLRNAARWAPLRHRIRRS